MSEPRAVRAERDDAVGIVDRACPACGEVGLELILHLDDVPVQCTQLIADPTLALDVPRGSLVLAVCERCTLVSNTAFDPTLVPYDGDYENSQFFSSGFAAFAGELARDLVERHALRKSTVVEIGSGHGDFLELLCRAGDNRGIGFDPSYGGETTARPGVDLTLVREPFDSSNVPPGVALVCARHVLEHFARPAEFLGDLHRALAEEPDALLYLEVPNAEFTMTPSGVWDLIYQHCSYFSDIALREVVERAGFSVLAVRPAFGGQFLGVEARIARHDGDTPLPDARPDERAARLAAARDASANLERAIASWRDRLARLDPARVVLWGAGAKGVTFLNVAGRADDGRVLVGAAVDVNERKWGTFVPGTAQPVLGPAELCELPGVDLVVLANAVYRDEVVAELDRLGVGAAVEAL